MLLYLKFTLTFVAFGLLVGYTAFIVIGIDAAQRLLEEARELFSRSIQELNTGGGDLLQRFSDRSAVEKLSRSLASLVAPMELGEGFNFRLFYREESAGRWMQLLDVGRELPKPVPVPPGLVYRLEGALKGSDSHPFSPSFNAYGVVDLLINVTTKADTHSYVIWLSARRERIDAFLRARKDLFITYTLAVLAFSLLVGALFARRLGHPIRQLSRQAWRVSQGKLDARFSFRRRDDLGRLAWSLDRMTRHLASRISTMETMNRIDQAVLSSLSRRDLLAAVAGLISGQFRRCGVAVLEHTARGYRLLAGAGGGPGDLRPEDLGEEIAADRLPEPLRGRFLEPLEAREAGPDLLGRLFEPQALRRYVCSVPIRHAGRQVGLIVLSIDALDEEDREAIRLLADQTGVALQSFYEAEKRDSMYSGMLLSLTRTVDAKSRWTAGHSERVAAFAAATAGELRLEADLQNAVRMAGFLHDIGKLGVPEAILDKPGRLTGKEYAIVREHPLRGERIVAAIPDFARIREGIRGHHERWDGRGYPDGMAGEEIPLVARLMAVADIYDAISTDRPYRRALSPPDAVSFMQDNRGVLFDPGLVDAFLSSLSRGASA